MTTAEREAIDAEFKVQKEALQARIDSMGVELDKAVTTVRELNNSMVALRNSMVELHISFNKKRFPHANPPETRINLS